MKWNAREEAARHTCRTILTCGENDILVPKSWQAGRCSNRGFEFRPGWTLRRRWRSLHGTKFRLAGSRIIVRSISGEVSLWHFLLKESANHTSWKNTRFLFGSATGLDLASRFPPIPQKARDARNAEAVRTGRGSDIKEDNTRLLCSELKQLRHTKGNERVARVGESVRVVETEETQNPADAKAGFKQSRTNIERTKGG